MATVLPQSTRLQHWVLPGAAAAGRAASSLPHYPYTDKHFAWIRTKLQAVPWCEECEHCHMLQWATLHTRRMHGGAAEPQRLLGNMLHGRAPASTGILASSVKQNHFQLYSEGDTDLGPVFTTDVSSYGPRITETRLDLQRISRSTIVDQQ